MHALHSLAHRAPPATRTRVRWQPYNSIPNPSCSSSSTRSPPNSYLNTPISSVKSSSPLATPTTEFDRIRHTLPSATPQVPKDLPFRDTCRNKYAIGLVDQAVKSLCEIWRPQDIPHVFVSSSRALAAVGVAHESSPTVDPKPPLQKHHARNTQLPSPISPSSRASPSPTAPSSSPSVPAQALPSSEQDIACTSGSRSNLVPIRSFVHEVLRRSRTSGCVLQTALCYLEAIRPKVPQLLRQEQSGDGIKNESELTERISLATEAELAREAEFSMDLDSSVDVAEHIEGEDVMKTVRVQDDNTLDLSVGTSDQISQDGPSSLQQEIAKKTAANLALPPTPRLPSPLLCPRRAFLASLILASKFTQDKCYSNRAWAKLSGLPPREIGRCERALGEALEWRLWVGKRPPQTISPPALAPANRPVVRSQSEGSLLTQMSTPTPFLVRNEKSGLLASSGTPSSSTLRRCATLPVEFLPHSAAGPATFDPVPRKTFIPDLSTLDSQDKFMRSPDQITPDVSNKPMDLTPSTSTFLNYTDKISQSPSPQTPGLSYSPSSTESSSGDRTIQMSTFLDDTMASVNTSNLGIGNSESWSWLDTETTTSKILSPTFNEQITRKGNPLSEHFGPAKSVIGYGSSSQPNALHFIGTNALGCPWVADSGMMYQLHS